MKVFYVAIIFLLVQNLFADEPKGPSVQVELLSGTKQKAQFLGIKQDTVFLGGYISNQFTVIRLPKEKFKSIIDSSGADLLHISSVDSNQIATDSTYSDNNFVNDSLNNSTENDKLPKTISKLSSDIVLVGFESNYSDSIFTLQINSLIARLLFENGEKVQVISHSEMPDCSDNVCMQNYLSTLGAKIIYFGKITPIEKRDSLKIELTRVIYEEALPSIYKQSFKVSKENPITDAITKNKLQIFILESLEKNADHLKTSKGYVYVETDPEGATLSLAEKHALCKTPCTFPVTDTIPLAVHTYWTVEQHLWGASATLKPVMGDTVKAYLKLKRVNPELKVLSNPTGAEIFSGKEPISKRSVAFGITPAKFSIQEPGLVQFRVRKYGFKDSLVTVYVPPVSDVTVNLNLEEETDFDVIKSQQAWSKDRTKIRIGHTLMGISIAPIIVGALFTYLGQLDYEDAKDIRNELKATATTGGAYFQEKMKENKDYIDDGDKKTITGISLIGLGVLVLGVGFFIAF